MDEAFLEAWINRDDHVVLGRRLHPLCLLDALAFEIVRSPFSSLFSDDGILEQLTSVITNGHLQMAVAICSTPYEDLLSFISNPNRPSTFLWRTSCLFRDFEAAAVDFQTYIADYLTVPETWDVSDYESSFDPGTPWPLKLVTFLTVQGRMDNDKVWRMPIGQAIWTASSVSEMSGSVQVLTPELVEISRMAEEAQNESA